jgi:broad specificity phosphatase PhoE
MIWLARHAETTWNLAGRYQGRLESMLSGMGMQQAFALAGYFADRMSRGEAIPERVVSSPLLRCAATARASADRLDLEVETDDRLIEIAHGTWEGRYRDELEANDPEVYRAWRERPADVVFDGGESLADVLARWQDFARSLAADSRRTLVLTHDAVVRVALVGLEGKRLDDFWNVRVANAAFATIERRDGTLVLESDYNADHLRGIEADAASQAL